MSVTTPDTLHMCAGCIQYDESGEIACATLLSGVGADGEPTLCIDCSAVVNRIQEVETFAVVPKPRNKFIEGLICGMAFIVLIEMMGRIL